MRVGLQVGRLGHHVQPRKQSQAFIEDQIHDMAFAFGAGELQPQKGKPGLSGRDHFAARVTSLPNQAGQVAIHQQGQKQEQAAELSCEAARGKRKLAAIGDGSGCGKERCRPFFILAPRQAGKACFVQDLPDSGGTQGSLLGLEGAFDVVDGEVLLAHPQNQLADGVFLGLAVGAMLEFTEEVGLGATEMMAQDAKRAWSVAKAAGVSVAAKKGTKMAAKWSPARGAVGSEPFPLLRGVVRNGPELSRARRCWARRSEPLTARTVLR